MIKDYFRMAYQSIRHRRLRSYLTMIGIIIGIVSLVTLISLGNSLEKGIQDRFDQFGTRRVLIAGKVVGGFGGPPSGIAPITQDDANAIDKIPQVEYVTTILIERLSVEYGREELGTDIRGISVENIDKFYHDIGLQPEEGRFLQDSDRYSAFISKPLAEDFFDRDVPVKAGLTIGGQKFRVVGILESQGGTDDYVISVPIDTLRELLDRPNAVSGIAVQLNKGVDLDFAIERIERLLERRRGDENFQVTSPQKIADQAGGIIKAVSLVVAAIAFISLIVGALGITNSMYTSVFERTRQIGVMKAIGARNMDIVLIFLFESGFLGIIGGLVGITVGIGLSWIVATLLAQAGLLEVSFYIDPNLVVFGLLFSFLLGMASGTFPALKAARQKPVDALRYE